MITDGGSKKGSLTSCNGRVELSVIDYTDGKILYADRITTRSVDLSEQIAGKAALQKGAHAPCLKILQHFADTLPAAGH